MPAQFVIEEYRIVPAEMTGFGWKAVQKWDGFEYRHMASFRSEDEAKKFIEIQERQKKISD